MRAQQIPVNPTRLLRKRAVCDRVQLSSTTIWRLQRAGRFPKSIRISAGAVAWREADIERWIAERAAGVDAVAELRS
jgi:prophage regulatory protein